MKIKTLSIVAAALAVASVGAWLLGQRETGPKSDPRVGQPVLGADIVPKVAAMHLRSGGQTITLVNTEPAGSAWVVREYHDMPVDFQKLTRFVADLREAKVERFVSASAERMARMEFGDTVIELRDAGDKPVWTAVLGKSGTGGGRFIKFGDEERAYMAGLSAWIDSTAKNWAQAALITTKPEQVTGIEVGFAENASLRLSRENSTSPWKAEGATAEEKVRDSAVSSLLTSLTGLRFTETTEPGAEDAVAAREHARTFTLTANDGRVLTIALGRRPAPPAPPPPPPPAEGETAPPAPPAPQPGPVFAFVTSSMSTDPINTLMQKRAFQIAEWTFTGLPTDRAALIEKVAPPPPPPAPPPPPSAPAASETAEIPAPPKPRSFPDEQAEAAFIAAEFADFEAGTGGLRYKVLAEGEGEKPAAGVRVKAHYAGRLLDGTEFDSSYKRGEPFSFTLGRGQVIKGWDDTLIDMKKGEKRLVVIPYKLGYGERGAGADIPPRATLVFDIELVEFE